MLFVTHTPADEHDPAKDCPWPGLLNPMLAAPLSAAMAGGLPVDEEGIKTPIIKVCGMREADNIREVEATGVDWMGFIFCPASPRHVSSLPSYLPVHCQRVGVFVDASPEEIASKVSDFALHVVQLHGHESPDFCQELRRVLPEGIVLMKMLPVREASDLQQTAAYEDVVDLFLLEPKAKALGAQHYGGSGQQFDWHLLSHYPSAHPFLLAGGLSPDDALALANLWRQSLSPEASGLAHLLGFDLNSRFEISPALKDPLQIKTFIQAIRPVP